MNGSTAKIYRKFVKSQTKGGALNRTLYRQLKKKHNAGSTSYKKIALKYCKDQIVP